MARIVLPRRVVGGGVGPAALEIQNPDGSRATTIAPNGSVKLGLSGTVRQELWGTVANIDVNAVESAQTITAAGIRAGTPLDLSPLATGSPQTVQARIGTGVDALLSQEVTLQALADSVAPVLSGLTPSSTQTSVTLGLSTDEGNGTIYYLLDQLATRTAAQVKAGGGIASGSQPVSASGAQSAISVGGLTAGTGYYMHVMHEDAAGNQSVVSNASITTAAAGAALASPTGTILSPSELVMAADVTNGDGYLYGVLTTSATAPTGAQIIARRNSAGTDALWSARRVVESIGGVTRLPKSIMLTPGATVYGHMVHRRSNGALTEVVSTGPLTLQAAPAVTPVTLGTTLSNGQLTPGTATFTATSATANAAGTSDYVVMIMLEMTSQATSPVPISVTLNGVAGTVRHSATKWNSGASANCGISWVTFPSVPSGGTMVIEAAGAPRAAMYDICAVTGADLTRIIPTQGDIDSARYAWVPQGSAGLVAGIRLGSTSSAFSIPPGWTSRKSNTTVGSDRSYFTARKSSIAVGDQSIQTGFINLTIFNLTSSVYLVPTAAAFDAADTKTPQEVVSLRPRSAKRTTERRIEVGRIGSAYAGTVTAQIWIDGIAQTVSAQTRDGVSKLVFTPTHHGQVQGVVTVDGTRHYVRGEALRVIPPNNSAIRTTWGAQNGFASMIDAYPTPDAGITPTVVTTVAELATAINGAAAGSTLVIQDVDLRTGGSLNLSSSFLDLRGVQVMAQTYGGVKVDNISFLGTSNLEMVGFHADGTIEAGAVRYGWQEIRHAQANRYKADINDNATMAPDEVLFSRITPTSDGAVTNQWLFKYVPVLKVEQYLNDWCTNDDTMQGKGLNDAVFRRGVHSRYMMPTTPGAHADGFQNHTLGKTCRYCIEDVVAIDVKETENIGWQAPIFFEQLSGGDYRDVWIDNCMFTCSNVNGMLIQGAARNFVISRTSCGKSVDTSSSNGNLADSIRFEKTLVNNFASYNATICSKFDSYEVDDTGTTRSAAFWPDFDAVPAVLDNWRRFRPVSPANAYSSLGASGLYSDLDAIRVAQGVA